MPSVAAIIVHLKTEAVAVAQLVLDRDAARVGARDGDRDRGRGRGKGRAGSVHAWCGVR